MFDRVHCQIAVCHFRSSPLSFVDMPHKTSSLAHQKVFKIYRFLLTSNFHFLFFWYSLLFLPLSFFLEFSKNLSHHFFSAVGYIPWFNYFFLLGSGHLPSAPDNFLSHYQTTTQPVSLLFRPLALVAILK